MPAIEIRGLQKKYTVGFFRSKEKLGLRDLTLDINEGEVFGCLGPNGAGKTTTLKILMGLVFPTAGTARIFGRDVGDPSVKAQIGFLPEQPYFYDYLTAFELLEYYAQLSGMPAPDRKRRANEMLARVGLGESARLQLRKFSKGMLQRLGIAQAILHDPKLLFLDEPMSGLDPVGRREVRDLIQDLHDEGKTIFFSTHILSDAESLCDRLAVLDKGELRGTAVVAELAAMARGKMEIIWDGALAKPAIAALGGEVRVAGALFRAQIAENQLDVALEKIRQTGSRLISLNPVRANVEEFFLSHIAEEKQ